MDAPKFEIIFYSKLQSLRELLNLTIGSESAILVINDRSKSSFNIDCKLKSEDKIMTDTDFYLYDGQASDLILVDALPKTVSKALTLKRDQIIILISEKNISYLSEINLLISGPTYSKHSLKTRLKLKHHTHLTPLSSLQKKTHPEPAKLSNFLYPVTKELPDIDISEGGWMTSKLLEHLPYLSPKINRLVKILQDSQGKGLIITETEDRAGARLLTTLLRYKKFNTILLSSNDNEEDTIYKILTFNMLKAEDKPILLSNVIPDARLISIEHIHFLDSAPDSSHYYDLLDRLTDGTIQIHYHICTEGNEKEKYLLFANTLKKDDHDLRNAKAVN